MKTPTEILQTNGFSDEAIKHIIEKGNAIDWDWKPITA